MPVCACNAYCEWYNQYFFLIFANSLILTADSLFNLFFHHDWTAFLYDDIICRKNNLYLQNFLNYAKNNMFQNNLFF